MTQKVQVLATTPNNLNKTPGIHTVEDEDTLMQDVL